MTQIFFIRYVPFFTIHAQRCKSPVAISVASAQKDDLHALPLEARQPTTANFQILVMCIPPKHSALQSAIPQNAFFFL